MSVNLQVVAAFVYSPAAIGDSVTASDYPPDEFFAQQKPADLYIIANRLKACGFCEERYLVLLRRNAEFFSDSGTTYRRSSPKNREEVPFTDIENP